ncbi:MAG: DUF4224 domain-containing protein [Phycisphaera sp. TMED24]|nr:MAG: DUF4224 domain-containing protein [Phycisphaera sp. TMED24]
MTRSGPVGVGASHGCIDGAVEPKRSVAREDFGRRRSPQCESLRQEGVEFWTTVRGRITAMDA